MRSTWEDPPEYREPSGGAEGASQLHFPTLTPVVKAVIIANGALFLLFFLLTRPAALVGPVSSVYKALALTPAMWREWFPLLPLWQPLTYGFLHSLTGPGHLLFNMLAVYFFGTMMEGLVGSRRFAVFYGTAIVLGGLVQLLVGLPQADAVPTVGASGGVLGLIVAMAVLRPDTRVIFILFPLRLKTLAMILVGMDVFFLLAGTGGSTAVLVHLTGAAWGALAARKGWIWRDPVEAMRERSERVAEERQADDAERLDRLLDRIHREGMSSLTRREKEFLKRVSSRR